MTQLLNVCYETKNTFNYQRPPSVGMPRHAFRRRAPETIYRRHPLLGGRKFFFHQNLCHWGRGPGWPVVRHSSLRNPGGKNVILETSRQNLLKFCIRLPITILRTNPYWHFGQKTQKVGQNLSFLVKKWQFFEKKIFQRQLLVAGSPSAKTPS